MDIHQFEIEKRLVETKRAERFGAAMGQYFAFFEYAIPSPYANLTGDDGTLDLKVVNSLIEETRIFVTAMQTLGKPVSLKLVAKRLQRIIARNKSTITPAQRETLLLLARCFAE